jgi:glutaredoxin-like protein NrdH
MINVYTNENCTQCEQTKKFLDKVGLEYNVKPFAEHPEELKRFVEMGFKAAPIVETDTDVWSGFKIDKLNGLAEASL